MELTRTRIREAASRVFFEQHYDRTTMDQIAAAAQVQRSTVYMHFKDKTAILAAIVEDYLPRARKVMERLPGPSPSHTEIEQWIETVAKFWRQEKVAATILQEVGREAPGLPSLRELATELYQGLARNVPAFADLDEALVELSDKRSHAEMLIFQLTFTCNQALSRSDKQHVAALRRLTAEAFAVFIEKYRPKATER